MAASETAVTVRGLHHAGVVVSDLAVSVPWYVEMFGGTERLHVKTADFELVMLALANSSIELLVHRPGGRSDGLPGPTDLGAGHFALHVDDVVAAHARLAQRGVAFASLPERVAEGPSAGWVIAFCLDPDGNRIELIEEP